MIRFPAPAEGLAQLAVAALGATAFAVVAFGLVALFHRLAAPVVGRAIGSGRALDRWLAVTAAGWLGLDEAKAWRRWTRLLATLFVLALFGALTPPVCAIPALIVGLGGVLAVFRRWTWDEEDRAAGLSGEHKRAPGSEDFNNEFLVAVSTIFLFGSLLIWRLTGVDMFRAGPSSGLIENLIYVGSETLEALPIIGNVEVLGYDNPSVVQAVLPSGGWVAFVLRMALDVLVIGGLLKVVEIAGRISKGLDLRRLDGQLARGGDAAVGGIRELYRLSMAGAGAASDRLESVALGEVTEDVDLRFAAIGRLIDLTNQGVAGHRHFLDVVMQSQQDILRRARQTPEMTHLRGALLKDIGQIRLHRALRASRDEALELLQLAIAALQEALTHLGEDDPHRASTELDLGEAAAHLARRVPEGEDRIALHRLARDARGRALAALIGIAGAERRTSARFQHALSTGQLGEAMNDYAGNVLLGDAVEAYRALRAERPMMDRRSDQAALMAWGAGLQGMAMILDVLAQRVEGDAGLAYAREAVAVTAEAVSVMEHSHNIVAACGVQAAHGAALVKVAARVTGAERLETLNRAVEHLRDSLLLMSPSDSPVGWAEATGILGLALGGRGGEREGPEGVNDLIEAVDVLRGLTEHEQAHGVGEDQVGTYLNLIRIERRLAMRTSNSALATDALRRLNLLIDLEARQGQPRDAMTKLKAQLEDTVAELAAGTRPD